MSRIFLLCLLWVSLDLSAQDQFIDLSSYINPQSKTFLGEYQITQQGHLMVLERTEDNRAEGIVKARILIFDIRGLTKEMYEYGPPLATILDIPRPYQVLSFGYVPGNEAKLPGHYLVCTVNLRDNPGFYNTLVFDELGGQEGRLLDLENNQTDSDNLYFFRIVNVNRRTFFNGLNMRSNPSGAPVLQEFQIGYQGGEFIVDRMGTTPFSNLSSFENPIRYLKDRWIVPTLSSEAIMVFETLQDSAKYYPITSKGKIFSQATPATADLPGFRSWLQELSDSPKATSQDIVHKISRIVGAYPSGNQVILGYNNPAPEGGKVAFTLNFVCRSRDRDLKKNACVFSPINEGFFVGVFEDRIFYIKGQNDKIFTMDHQHGKE